MVMSNPQQPFPQAPSFGIELRSRPGGRDKHFLHDVCHRGRPWPNGSRDVPPDFHAVRVVQRGPGVPKAGSQSADQRRFVMFVEQLSVFCRNQDIVKNDLR